jgi:hypothetical protein
VRLASRFFAHACSLRACDERVLDDAVLDAALAELVAELGDRLDVEPLEVEEDRGAHAIEAVLDRPDEDLFLGAFHGYASSLAAGVVQRVDANAGAHRRRERDALQVDALGGRRLRADERLDQRVRR